MALLEFPPRDKLESAVKCQAPPCGLRQGGHHIDERPWVDLLASPRRLVTMGKFGTYKNLETLLAAFDQLRADPKHADYQLVFGGSDHPAAEGYMARLAATRHRSPRMIFAGYINEDAVATFFETARQSVLDYESTTGSPCVLHQTATYGEVPVFPRISDFVDVCKSEGLGGYHYSPGCVADMAAEMA